ncbi:MAG: hypothetical protein DYH08_12525 [Actinobacteria bacterium ATB1]|nr:hypothetical protein [Actinobacteria bacterium ATB1]
MAGTGVSGPLAVDTRSIPEMVLAAAEAALADAQTDFGNIDAVVTASVDLHDGLTASNIAVTEVVGAVMKPETRIAGDGLAAAAHAACQIWAGAYGTVLVVAHGKASMADQDSVEQWAWDPITIQPLGVGFTVAAGLQARAVMGEGDPEAALSRWATVASRRWQAVGVGSRPEDVLASPVTAAPLRALMAAPAADAAYAVVLTGEPQRRGPVLKGVGYDLDTHAPGDRDLASWAGLGRAFARACRVAGSDTGAAFDIVEASCRYPHEEELVAAAVPALADSDVAPSGGLYRGVAPVAAGLGRLVDTVDALRSGPPARALAHGTWGPAGQAHAVAILESAP